MLCVPTGNILVVKWWRSSVLCKIESDSHDLLDEKRSLFARAICGEDVLVERA